MTQLINGTPVNKMPCCGIFAVAYVVGRSPQEIFDLYRLKFKRGLKWRGGTNILRILEVLTHLDVEYERWTARAASRTLRTFSRDVGEPDLTYLIRVSGHFLVMCNGTVTDQSGSWNMDAYRRSRSRITHCYAIATGAP
jgi:hypothetical protein